MSKFWIYATVLCFGCNEISSHTSDKWEETFSESVRLSQGNTRIQCDHDSISGVLRILVNGGEVIREKIVQAESEFFLNKNFYVLKDDYIDSTSIYLDDNLLLVPFYGVNYRLGIEVFNLNSHQFVPWADNKRYYDSFGSYGMYDANRNILKDIYRDFDGSWHVSEFGISNDSLFLNNVHYPYERNKEHSMEEVYIDLLRYQLK
ncbi:MAG: hypothetical protein RLZZ262_792 [Bacteroidota bacterium]|jgi:hypothetical protein